jgi:hypothetical protein
VTSSLDIGHYGNKQCPGKVLATTGPGCMTKHSGEKCGICINHATSYNFIGS